ncbi:MAG TPA: hypothetical protein VFG31_07470, partial [Conexibacter sp.]|nr:hypothetical protein [Conexibacter sp.]
LTACSIAQFPSPPWKQVHRLRTESAAAAALEAGPLEASQDPATRRFFTSLADGPRRFVVRSGAPVALLATTGHRIADAYGIRDVTPYTGYDSLMTFEHLERTLDALRDAGGNTLLTPRTDLTSFNRVLIRRGFRVVTEHGLRTPRFAEPQDANAVTKLSPTSVANFVKWVDTRHLHPAALR